MSYDPKIFKAYDIRGIYPDQIDEDTVYKIGQAYLKVIGGKKIAVGRDVRVHGEKLKSALIRSLTDAGCDVVDIGVISTDMLYFAVGSYGLDGGLTISASHNPAEYNGVKMVGKGVKAISSETGLFEIRDAMGQMMVSDKKGKVEVKDIFEDYSKYLLNIAQIKKIKPLKIVANANFGMAGVAFKKIIETGKLPFEVVELNFKPDGTFPKGRPDPLIEENRTEFLKLIEKEKPDFGVAWDADADRCFFATQDGIFLEGYFIVGLLAEIILKKYPKGKILYDPRLTWATIEKVNKLGGIPMVNKAGHSFIKDRMRKEDAVFAGEMSAHFYFKDFFYADNGMLPILFIAKHMSETDKTLRELVDEYLSKYFISGEINNSVADPKKILDRIKEKYNDAKIEFIDGISIEYENWRANIRSSQTEPLLRLNVEAKERGLMEEKRDELLAIIKNA